MPAKIDRSLVQVNDANSGNVEFDESQVTVFNTPQAMEKVAAVAETAGLREDDGARPQR